MLALLAARDGWSIDVMYGLLGGGIALVALLAVQWLLLPFRSEKVFRQTARIDEPKQFMADMNGFDYTWSAGHNRVEWLDLVKWDENSDLLALYPNSLSAYPLPKSQIEPEMLGFIRGRLQQSGLTKRGKLRQ